MIDWRALNDAYGSADVVPELLERAEANDCTVWDELWSRLFHQGTVYTASYAALPRLAALAARRDPHVVEPLYLATSILASADGPEPPASVRARYADDVALLRAVALDALALADDDTDFVYRAQAVLAAEGSGPWASRLAALADGEVELVCDACGEQRLVGFEDSTSEPPCLAAADPAKLTDSEARAYALAIAHGRHLVAKHMAMLFGEFACPVCGSRRRASQALA